MKITENFKLRRIAGQSIIIAEGIENIDFNKMLVLNDTAALLWENLEGKEFSIQDAADILTANYDVTPETALADVTETINNLLSAGALQK